MMKRMACALALAAGTGLTLGVATHTALAQPTPATAASGLKLSVASLGAVTADTPVELNVNFRGGKVRGVEVYLDGNRIANESIDTVETHGVISFKLPASLLAEGAHEIMIQAVDKDGNTASTTTRVRVNPPAVESIAHFVTPKRNAVVNDLASLEVKVDDNIKDAIVMFFIDGNWLSMRNYAPYVQTLDTSKYTDGEHTIKVQVFDSTGTSIIKTMTMPLRIHNGDPKFTTVQKNTPDLNKVNKPKTSEADAALSIAQTNPLVTQLGAPSATGLARSNANARTSVGMRTGVEPRANYETVKPTPFATPAMALPGASNLTNPGKDIARMENGAVSKRPTSIATPVEKLTPTNHDGHPTVHAVPQNLIAPAFPGVLADPTDLSALSGETAHVAHQNANVRRAGNVAARPSMKMGGGVVTVQAHTQKASTGHSTQIAQAAPRAHVGSRSMHNAHIKTFDVAFDNTQIAFDVPPRIENGLPLAPFRAIFEHSGGSVKWYGESKTVRAVNNSKEIEIHIGDSEATVNNQKVKMDAKATIDRGRTIVPLSFIKDSMDVKVTYDAATGHVLIESNK